MSDFLSNIAARSLGTARGIRPRAIPIFAEEDTPGVREFESSFDLDPRVPDTGIPPSRAPESPQLHRLEALRHPAEGHAESATPADSPAPRLQTDAVTPPPTNPTQAQPEIPIPAALTPPERHRPSPTPTLSTVPTPEQSARPDRTTTATPPAIRDKPNPAPEAAPNLASPARPGSRTSPPSPVAHTRDQPPSPVPPANAPLPSPSATMPDLPAPAPSSAPIPAAVSATRQAPDPPAVFTETASNPPALRPSNRPAPFPIASDRRPRNAPSLRQSTRLGAGPAEPEIHITIGRVDVRANLASPAQEKRDRTNSSLQLADYLKRRDGSGAL